MSQLQTSTISVPRANGKGMMDSYLAKPEGDSPFAAIIVIHEIFGLNDNIRDISRQFAEQGYVALGVDLFSNRNRMVCMLQIIHGMLIRPLNNSMLADLKSAIAVLQKQPDVDANRIGAVGFCMGGTYALQLAITDKGMKAASIFYGANPRPLEAVAETCPIVGSYPDKDFTTKAARELETSLTKYNVPHNIKIYDNTQHSFYSQQRTPFEVDASKDAWERMLSFFDTYL
ncbi:MAG TPA: dienelactone hydrolase family protein, partial [Anaerolineales bacterium]|nr:dienelactone hydrolase family protein [Anaerolineales bacterium]